MTKLKESKETLKVNTLEMLAVLNEEIASLQAEKREIIKNTAPHFQPVQVGDIIEYYESSVSQWGEVKIEEVVVYDFPNRWNIQFEILKISGRDDNQYVGTKVTRIIHVDGNTWRPLTPK